jgi:uncharacterized protein with GYD domain
MRHIAASDAYPIAIFGGPSSALVCRRQRALLPDLLAVERAVAGVGGSLESFHFAFGGDDVYVMADAPDNAAAMAMAVAVGSSGAIDSYQTVVLLSPSEVDKAMSVAVDYTPPGS